ncbi:L-lactate dehydrogenase-like [Cardiocondyla obscurior]|uniref:L-lactate dehydrogenase-like n=1 Tax=Cardiocondyla obscurior TaxID=286306 RepID=UPI0039655A95
MITWLNKTFSRKAYLILNKVISRYDFFCVNIQISSIKTRNDLYLDSQKNMPRILKCIRIKEKKKKKISTTFAIIYNLKLTLDFYKVKNGEGGGIIAVCEKKYDEELNVRHNVQVLKKIVPTIAKLACKVVLLVVTQSIDVMSYVTWKLSKFPSSRVLGTGTLLDSCRFQDLLSRKFGLARTSINCMSIDAQGDTSVPIWSNVHVAGTKIRDINPRMGEANDPGKWRDISEAVNKTDAELNRKKSERRPSCWTLGFCTAEIVDAVVRNIKAVLPVSTYIHSCAHGTDKDVYMSVPCVLGREGVHARVRQKLNDQEKTALQRCADSIRDVLRECGIPRESNDIEE